MLTFFALILYYTLCATCIQSNRQTTDIVDGVQLMRETIETLEHDEEEKKDALMQRQVKHITQHYVSRVKNMLM